MVGLGGKMLHRSPLLRLVSRSSVALNSRRREFADSARALGDEAHKHALAEVRRARRREREEQDEAVLFNVARTALNGKVNGGSAAVSEQRRKVIDSFVSNQVSVLMGTLLGETRYCRERNTLFFVFLIRLRTNQFFF